MKLKPFLTAQWNDLILANYIVDPAILIPHVPPGTELDFFHDQCYVSLVGFMFNNVRVKGIRIPWHTDFPEVNLRFYVRYKENDEWKRGVVFIKEIVPKRAITLVANTFFGERYVTLPMTHSRKIADGQLTVSYAWKYNHWGLLTVTSGDQKAAISASGEAYFITQHFWGYTAGRDRTGEYHVQHPPWELYPVQQYAVQCDFGALYGAEFKFLAGEKPYSVFLAEGSAVTVYNKRFI